MSHLTKFEPLEPRLIKRRDGSFDFDTLHRIIGKDGNIRVITGTEYLKLWSKRKRKQIAVWFLTMHLPRTRQPLKKKKKKK